jgi:hypothetical protein
MRLGESSEFEIRPARDGDRGHVIALVSEMFRADVSQRYDWLYRRNPHGKALSWLAFDRASGDAVGVTSLFPRRVLVDGQMRAGSIGGDCYILPRARRRGLATLLHRASFAEMAPAGVDFMFGPPRPNNLGALLKAGSHEVTVFERFTHPLSGDALMAATRKRLPATLGPLTSRIAAGVASVAVRALGTLARFSTRGYRLEPLVEVPADWERVHAYLAAGHRICAVRDAAFLAWRYRDPAAGSQKAYLVRREQAVVGLVAIEVGRDVGEIVDLFVRLDGEIIDAALQLAIDVIRDAGCARADFSVTPGAPVAARFRRHALIGRDRVVFQVACADGDEQRHVLLDDAAWHFTNGDKDSETVFSVEPE